MNMQDMQNRPESEREAVKSNMKRATESAPAEFRDKANESKVVEIGDDLTNRPIQGITPASSPLPSQERRAVTIAKRASARQPTPHGSGAGARPATSWRTGLRRSARSTLTPTLRPPSSHLRASRPASVRPPTRGAPGTIASAWGSAIAPSSVCNPRLNPCSRPDARGASRASVDPPCGDPPQAARPSPDRYDAAQVPPS